MAQTITLVALACLLANVPLGMGREHSKKLSWQWFVWIHAAIPFIIALRIWLRLSWVAIPVNVAAAVAGQIIGGRWERKRLRLGAPLWPMVLWIVGALLVAALATCAAVLSREWLVPPRSRLALGSHYPDMPPDDRHHYLQLPVDHQRPDDGQFEGFYIMSPNFRRGQPVVFFLTDGQQELINTKPDDAFFQAFLGDIAYVLIGPRGQRPTLFPEVYRPDGKLNHTAALRLYGSDQAVDDVEAVRRDLERQGYLPDRGDIMVFGASGGGVLAQQYLARYGSHVQRALLESTGAPDLARVHGTHFARDFVDSNPEAATLLDGMATARKVDLAHLSFVLFKLAQSSSSDQVAAEQVSLVRRFATGDWFPYGRSWLQPRLNYTLTRFLLSEVPSEDAVRVRMYELLGSDLGDYLGRRDRSLNLLYEWTAQPLADYLAKQRAGELRPPVIEIDRSTFAGDVLVLAGTKDQVFGVERAKWVSGAYAHARLACFADGHRLVADEAFYRSIRSAFFSGGLGSPALESLLKDPRQLCR